MPRPPLDPAALTALVDDFYGAVRGDALLGPVFERALGADWQPHLARLADFWCTVMLGTRSYQGNVFAKHMQIEGVEVAHFQRWLALFEASATRLCAPPDAAELLTVARRIAGSLQYGYFGKIELA